MKTKKTSCGKLSGIRIYLSGPIENAKDDGASWRQQFISLTKENHLNFKIIDPTNKHDDMVGEIAEERKKMRQLKKNGKFKQITKKMKWVRRWDLRACDYVHCLVVYIDPTISSWGTPDEVYSVEDQQKPIFAVIEGGAYNAPDWTFPVIKYNEMFSSVEELVEHFKKLDSGQKRLDDRWVLIKNG